MLLFKIALASLVGAIYAAPSHLAARDAQTTVKLVNNCPETLQVGQLGSTLIAENQPIAFAPGASETYTFTGQWSGRFWARTDCTGVDGCPSASAANPASLAEFTFKANNVDWYDLSFVDGYNLPIKIDLVNPAAKDPNNPYWCGAPACATVPSCPTELNYTLNGVSAGCFSACSKFNDPLYCCSGAHSTPDTCPINEYAAQVKAECPQVYSYAYDDAASLYTCTASGYVITWCP